MTHERIQANFHRHLAFRSKYSQFAQEPTGCTMPQEGDAAYKSDFTLVKLNDLESLKE